jgi:flavin-dependent thymidylate synthase
MTKPGNQIERWADQSMYFARPDEQAEKGEPVTPRVTLVSMTSRPLQTMAAAAQLYAGLPVHSPSDVSQSVALNWFEDMTRTKLQAPLEFIDLHFLLEGVPRSFTDQLERQRTAVYVQESLRFAVKDNASGEVAYPPSLLDKKDDHPWRMIWDATCGYVGEAYNQLISAGMPAEDARGLLPLNITTRVHYKTNLRNLAEHAGMRLCSQAQYHWKEVWAGIIQAILDYGPNSEHWQQREIVKIFKPVCYQTGRCQFRAETDRWCSIRERVEAHYARGEAPATWVDIDPYEPLREGAARKAPGQ